LSRIAKACSQPGTLSGFEHELTSLCGCRINGFGEETSEHFQSLLNPMWDLWLESPAEHWDETQGQVLKEADRDLTSQSWMWVKTRSRRLGTTFENTAQRRCLCQ
jgi:hypothetical protein